MGKNNKIVTEVESLLKTDKIDPEVARRLQLSISLENHTELLKINGRLKKVEEVAEDWERNPSLVWLLRFKTKKTVTVIISTLLAAFLAFELLWHYGLMPKILEWLHLPPVIP